VRSKTDFIKLGFQSGQNGIYSISIKDKVDISEAILEDTKTNTFHNLFSGSYEFVWEITDNEERFVLHFTPMTITNQQANLITIYSYDNKVCINNNTADHGIIMIYNTMGQLISETALQKGLNKVTIDNAGSYVVQVITGNKVETKKVIIK
jgi:hypothetical protein